MTSTAEIERALITALDTIRTNWHQLTQPTKGGSGGGSKSADTTTALDRAISLRHETSRTLNDWAAIIIEANQITQGAPLGTDTIAVTEFIQRWARWFSGHPAGPDAADEITHAAHKIWAATNTGRAEHTHIGYCPTIDDGLLCWGDIHAYPNADPPMAPFCQRCGTVKYVDEWERAMRLDGVITHAELTEFIREQFGREVTRSTLRVWLHRKVISVCGVDESGQALYDKGAIIYALSKRWEPGFDLQTTAM